MQHAPPGRPIMKKHLPALSRRQFLFTGVALAVGAPRTPSLVDELTSCLDNKDEDLPPTRGESLPPCIAPSKGEATPKHGLEENDHLFLTFDDGPIPCTGRILDLLAQTQHKATFFVIGRNLTDPKLRDLAVRALHEGHDLGNHSFSHPYFSRISAKQAEREIVSTHALIEEVVQEAGVPRERQNRFFRFPYGVSGSGSTHRKGHDVLAALGYQIAWWDLDTNDWRMELTWFPRPLGKVVAALTKAKPQDVVLLHDRSKTARYLPQLMAVLEPQKLVSLPLSRYESHLDGPLRGDPIPESCQELSPPDGDEPENLFGDFLQQIGPWNDSLDHSIQFEPILPSHRALW